MRSSLLKRIGLAAGLLVLTGGTRATLVAYQANGVDLVYDNDYTPVGASSPGLTWTANANLPATETFGVTGIGADGGMTWDKALEWIAAMNTANYAGANDWRLWSPFNSDGSGPCSGFDCDDSELGHLFYVEGGLSAGDAINDSAALKDVFTNMQHEAYWSGTERSPSNVWIFDGFRGEQLTGDALNTDHVWAVRPGQVAAAPLPGTALLMALGFGAMTVLRRARRRLR